MSVRSKLDHPAWRSARVVAASLVMSCAASSYSKERPSERDAGAGADAGAELGPRESLPRQARQLLEPRMRHHGAQMNELLNSVVTLDWPGVQRTCAGILEEPAIAPPLPGDDDSYNAQLPRSFFVYQERLLTAVRQLRVAADAKRDDTVQGALHSVVAACMDCHAAYLSESQRPSLNERTSTDR